MIVINGRFLTQNLTGVQRFALEISNQLFRILGKNNIICLVPNSEIKEVYNDYISNWNILKHGNKKGHLWEQIDLVRYLKNNNNPLLLNFTNTGPVLYKNKIVTLHDIAFIRCPAAFSFKFRFFYKILIPLILKTSKKIFTVSNFSKSEILKVYKFLSANDVEVVYNAVNKKFKKIENKNFNEEYILALSSLNPRKNFLNLIKAFLKFKEEKTSNNLKLYLIGNISKNFKSSEILKYINNNKDKILFFENPSDNEIIELYSNAKIFLYPSLYEGFGIPPLEAQSCETPVIASNVASLPEVLEDSVLYCNPYNIEDIKNKIIELLNNPELQKELIKKGLKNVKRFSWEKSAQKVKFVIENLDSQRK